MPSDDSGDEYLDDFENQSTEDESDGGDNYFEGESQPILNGTKKGKNVTYEYESLDPTALEMRMDNEVRDVLGVLGLDHAVAAILLRHFRWDKNKLYDKYMDSSAPVLEAAGLPPSLASSASPILPPSKRARLTRRDSLFECNICGMDGLTRAEMFEFPGAVGCRHKFCTECWKCHAESRIKDGSFIVPCMEGGCKLVLLDDDVRGLVDDEYFSRFKALIASSFVASSSHLRFCPHPSCTITIHCSNAPPSTRLSLVPTVFCSASHPFCFGCDHGGDHRPVICSVAKSWLKSAREDAGTAKWVKANTKDCPKCQKAIEKNGGCNRMVCGSCKFEFCWMCRRAWSTHGYNGAEACNKYIAENPDAAAETEVSKAKSDLNKWIFYFDRYNNIELSTKLDNELYAKTEKKMVDVMKQSGMSWIEAKFMENAVDELTKCRNTLKWSYAMAFFLQTGNDKQMFEAFQAYLEVAVEHLSQLLEEPIEAQTIASLRQRMTDKTNYVQKQCQVFLDDTAKGLLEGRWEWMISVE